MYFRDNQRVDVKETVKIAVRDLKLGMYVTELDRPWSETNFLFQGFILNNQADIEAVQSQCEYVFIDVSKQLVIEQSTAKDTPYSKGWLEDKKNRSNQSNFEGELYHAAQTHRQVSTVVKSFMQQITLGKSIDVALAKEVVAECVNNVIKAPDAMMWMTQLKNRDEYTAQHSMNVCIFAIYLGRQLNLSVPELKDLGLCGMMHDMGKMCIPLEVLNKPGRLTPEELKVMNSHTTLGWKLLMSSSNMYGGAIDTAYTHHERFDGKGYPRGLKAEGISPYARMVAIVDMYDAITSDRVYQKGRTHLEALSIMTKEEDTHLDSKFTIKFIECLGIYPLGSLVEMSNGEVAVVVEINPQQKIKPKVVFLLDEHKFPQNHQLVDLSKISTDKTGQLYRVAKMARADDYGIDLQAFFQERLQS